MVEVLVRDKNGNFVDDMKNDIFGIIEPQAEKVHQGEVNISIREAIENGLENLAFAFLTSAMELWPKEYELRVILKGEGKKTGGWEESITIPDRRIVI